MDVPLDRNANDKRHPEDWGVDKSKSWRQRKKFDQKNLDQLEEHPKDLWVEPSGRTDRLTDGFLLNRRKHQSVYFIRPTKFRVELTNNYNHFEGYNQKKRRACFAYGGREFSLGLTDPVFTDLYVKKFPAPGKPAIVVRPPYVDNCLLCVSLTPEFTGFHYKVVASVLELP